MKELSVSEIKEYGQSGNGVRPSHVRLTIEEFDFLTLQASTLPLEQEECQKEREAKNKLALRVIDLEQQLSASKREVVEEVLGYMVDECAGHYDLVCAIYKTRHHFKEKRDGMP
jgi:hypothetical protein